jgi:hypothetical protein
LQDLKLLFFSISVEKALVDAVGGRGHPQLAVMVGLPTDDIPRVLGDHLHLARPERRSCCMAFHEYFLMSGRNNQSLNRIDFMIRRSPATSSERSGVNILMFL